MFAIRSCRTGVFRGGREEQAKIRVPSPPEVIFYFDKRAVHTRNTK